MLPTVRNGVRLILEILKDKNIEKLALLQRAFGVSEATISADLEAAEEWFEPFNLKIIRKPGYGISIEGREKISVLPSGLYR